MADIVVRFVVGELPEDDINALKSDYAVISKLILTYDDFQLFNYKEGDKIEVETDHGDRLWCKINNLEILKHPERVIVIFTLLQAIAQPAS